MVSTKLYYLATEANVRERLAQGRSQQCRGWESNPRPSDRGSDSPSTKPDVRL